MGIDDLDPLTSPEPPDIRNDNEATQNKKNFLE